MFELNGKPISIDYLKQKAEEFGMSYEDFLNDALSTGNLVQKEGNKTMAGAGVLRREFLPSGFNFEPKKETKQKQPVKKQSLGDRISNAFNAYINPTIPLAEKPLYAAGFDVE